MKEALIIFNLIVTSAMGADVLSLDSALSEAFSSNPEISASIAHSDAESSAIRSKYFLDNPKLGLMRENNMSVNGTMESWAVTQEIMFPAKYFLMGGMQKARAQAAEQTALAKKLEIRKKVISAYFGVYVSDRIVRLLEAQKETLREIARIAETRYATGGVSQQDQMKAHVEQAKIENEIFMAKQEREAMAAMLNTVRNREASDVIELPITDLPVPKLRTELESLASAAKSSRMVKEKEFMVKEMEANRNIALWSYAPDFMISYRKPFGQETNNAYSISLEISIPLWFFMKQTSEVSSASAKLLESEKNLQQAIRETNSEARVLYSKAKTNESLLKIYETSLVPLATNTLNSSRAAYRAGRTSFIELLDSERALYDTRIAFYRTLAQFVESVSGLEEILATSVSSLPMGGEK